MLNNTNLLKQCGEILVCALVAGILIAGCGGGSASSGSSGFSQSYTTSVGAGDVLQFSVNTTNKTYSFNVIETSYGAGAVASGIPAASAVSNTETSTGTLTGPNAVGSYNLSASADGFIAGGEVFPIQNSFFVGHVIISSIAGHTRKIPIFGVANPVTTFASLAGTYNYQGYGCAGRSGGYAFGNIACSPHTGTISITSSGTFTTCKDGNLAASTPVCTLPVVGTSTASTNGDLVATATSGVYDFKTNDGHHRGWLFAFTAGGQNVAVIDHDDDFTPAFGHSIAISQTNLTSGQIDGHYFIKNNVGERHLMAISGVSFTDTPDTGSGTVPSAQVTGTLQYNNPWTGLVTYQFNARPASGVADIATIGAFTYTSSTIPFFYGVGLKY